MDSVLLVLSRRFPDYVYRLVSYMLSLISAASRPPRSAASVDTMEFSLTVLQDGVRIHADSECPDAAVPQVLNG